VTAFTRQLGREIQRLSARRRTYLGFWGFLALEVVILLLLSRADSREEFRRLLQENGLEFDRYFSGLTLGVEIVVWTGFMPGALFLAFVSGDTMANEAEEGTLRMVFCRPVSRRRVVVVKYLTCLLYTGALIGFLGVTALALGVATRGWGGLFVPPSLGHLVAWHGAGGVARFALGVPLLALGLTTVTSLGFLFSCLGMKPVTAMIGTISLVCLDFLFSSVPYFESVRPWFISARVAAWQLVFTDPIPWSRLTGDYACLLAVDLICVGLALAVFQRRDLPR